MAEALQALKLPELKEECRKLGLPVTGKKSELIERILEAQGKQGADANGGGAAEAEDAEVAEADAGTATTAQPAATAAPAAAPAAAAPAAPAPAPAGEQQQSKHSRIVFEAPTAAVPAAATTSAADGQPAQGKLIALDNKKPEAPGPAAPAAPAVKQPEAVDFTQLQSMTDEQRAALRKDKFKDQEQLKLEQRATRFGLPTAKAGDDPAEDEAKKAARRKRFGNVTEDDKAAQAAAEKLSLLGDDETRAKRMKRFGVVGVPVPELAAKAKQEIMDPGKLAARAARFEKDIKVGGTDEQRKKLRMERFAK